MPPKSTPKKSLTKQDRNVLPAHSLGRANEAQLPSHYEETQANEIEALKSIYMEDFQDIPTKTAWSKKAERSFSLILSAHSVKDLSIKLNVTLTATYPKSVPLLTVENMSNVRAKTFEEVRLLVSNRPKELLGEVMIFEIASSLQDVLEDAATDKARDDKIPSLDSERANKESEAARAAEEQRQLELEETKSARLVQERKAQEALSEELKKRESHKNTRSEAESDPTMASLDTIEFDHSIIFADERGSECKFRTVYLTGSNLAQSQAINEVRPAVVRSGRDSSLVLCVKRSIISRPSKLSDQSGLAVTKDLEASNQADTTSSTVFNLEHQLEVLIKLKHENILQVLAFRLEQSEDIWSLDVLEELANQGSLQDMLNVTNVFAVPRGKYFAIEILQGLDFLHKNNISHNRLHSRNVIFHRTSSGTITLKLADAGFQETLHNLKGTVKRASAWAAPEFPTAGRKRDMWDFGTILLEMLFGLAIRERYPSPQTLANSLDLSDALFDLMKSIFKVDPRGRPIPFELMAHEFFRTDAGTLESDSAASSKENSARGASRSAARRMKPDLNYTTSNISRYSSEWDEAGRLGKGGYGEVVKARNKLDNQVYAIKKIRQKLPEELSTVLSEVHLLATLNHPYVVRYYTAWEEADSSQNEDQAAALFTSGSFFSRPTASSINRSAGLDFISSSGYPKIEFGDSDGEEEEQEDDNEDEALLSSTDDNANQQISLQRTRSTSRAFIRSTLYIQMEYCERLTLRDMIVRGFGGDENLIWRLIRQVLEGLVHIHAHGIIHRDLKPDNVFIDRADNPKIGDFGLATAGQNLFGNTVAEDTQGDTELTQNVGTAFYVAPELRSGAGNYTNKVDMYSLGIILFEMCFPLNTRMERVQMLSAIREKDHHLPGAFDQPAKALQGEIITSLIVHRPADRPSSADLLRAGKIPVHVEDEDIRLALKSLGDESSPYYHKMLSALFARSSDSQLKAKVWDLLNTSAAREVSTAYSIVQMFVRETLTTCFRRHGAVEQDRQFILPCSDYYSNSNAYQILDASGTLLQLPYDLTFPYARALARGNQGYGKSFAFGTVYRDAHYGSAPSASREADFDIASADAKDIALHEAEVIRVVDELLEGFSPLANAQVCFHVSHSDLLDLILDHCRIPPPQHPRVKEIIGKLHIRNWTWQKIRLELRSPSVAISSTSIDELVKFDWRDSPEKAFMKLQEAFNNSKDLHRVQKLFTHISGLFEYCKRLGVRRKLYFSPLSSFNEKFFRGATMFQCLFDTRKRDIIAAGGRYDSLILEIRESHQVSVSDPSSPNHAVGIKIAWDTIVASMMRLVKQNENGNKVQEKIADIPHGGRSSCDVLVASFDSDVLRSAGLRVMSELWTNNISGEIALDIRTMDALLARQSNEKHGWLIIVNQQPGASTRPDLRIKSMAKGDDIDARFSELIPHMRNEIRERDELEGATQQAWKYRQLPAPDNADAEKKANVHVLIAKHRSKKTNKWQLVESAQQAAHELLKSFENGPIASVEIRDELLDAIRQTRLSDPDSWRKVIQDAPLSERQYLQELQGLVESFKRQAGEAARVAFIHNFRSGACIIYDLRL